ncbi:MAG: hypothetical protein CBC29_00025 [Methylococcaceae bacterium TMED69]|nr:MAG: hypothetical protein CBC29_00025 [Methylococcaceae bacterium TMED69]|tara:strand:- start:884 stop:1099 length:216 start_codon:yes stop_codon:yes gene_type:complete
MQSDNAEILIEGIKLAVAGMGMVGFFLTFLVFIITTSSKLYYKQSNDSTDLDTIAAITLAITKFRETKNHE